MKLLSCVGQLSSLQKTQIAHSQKPGVLVREAGVLVVTRLLALVILIVACNSCFSLSGFSNGFHLSLPILMGFIFLLVGRGNNMPLHGLWVNTLNLGER
jgi:hypothetical protein